VATTAVRVHAPGIAQRNKRDRQVESVMPSFGILSLISRLMVAILAGLGSAATEWIPPVEYLDRSELS
jgi:hypothetical protein